MYLAYQKIYHKNIFLNILLKLVILTTERDIKAPAEHYHGKLLCNSAVQLTCTFHSKLDIRLTRNLQYT